MYAIAIALCVSLLSSSSAIAQNLTETPAPAEPAPIDPEKLPVSLGRIRLKLSAPADKTSGLKIEQMIEVVGVAPPIELWTEEERAKMAHGPSPFGPPTQKEILDVITPQEFKRYPMDLNALMQWLKQKLGDSDSKRTE
jgi:hypothetical protein